MSSGGGGAKGIFGFLLIAVGVVAAYLLINGKLQDVWAVVTSAPGSSMPTSQPTQVSMTPTSTAPTTTSGAVNPDTRVATIYPSSATTMATYSPLGGVYNGTANNLSLHSVLTGVV